MIIGERLRLLREGRGLSQENIEERTGLKRCYISRVENGHTVPAIENLEKITRALEIPLYRLFYDGEEPPKVLTFPKPEDGSTWGSSGEEASYLKKLCKFLPRIDQRNRNLLLQTLNKMTGPKRRRSNGQ
jgi:transcriptional regulator with XRE-family HTH domain